MFVQCATTSNFKSMDFMPSFFICKKYNVIYGVYENYQIAMCFISSSHKDLTNGPSFFLCTNIQAL